MSLHGPLTDIAVVAFVALLCGMAMALIRQPAIVGYILAGVVLGPGALGLVSNRGPIEMLAELGVLMLLFLVGMELSLRSFRTVWKVAVAATALQVVASVLALSLMTQLFGWTLGQGLVLGFVVALSSTAVAVKILESIDELRTRTGRIVVGILIAQDLAFVPMMLAVGSLAGRGFGWESLGTIAASVAALLGVVWYLSRRERVSLPFSRLVVGHVDLTPLCGLVYCFGAATLSGLIGLTPAYGAFLAGLVIGNSAERHTMIEATRPIQSVLMMVFFLSIGLLLDPAFIWDNLGTVLLLLVMVVVFKTALNVGVLHFLGQPWERAFLSGLLLAQIGEFSFLLATAGSQAGALGPEAGRLVIAVTVLSLIISPLWVVTARRLHRLAEPGTTLEALLSQIYGREWDEVKRTLGPVRAGVVRLIGLLRGRQNADRGASGDA